MFFYWDNFFLDEWRENWYAEKTMLSLDEVNQLRQVFQEEMKPLKEGLQTVEKILDTVETKLDTVEKNIDIVEKKLDESIEDNASFFNAAGTFFDEMKGKIEKRIEALEEVLLIPKN